MNTHSWAVICILYCGSIFYPLSANPYNLERREVISPSGNSGDGFAENTQKPLELENKLENAQGLVKAENPKKSTQEISEQMAILAKKVKELALLKEKANQDAVAHSEAFEKAIQALQQEAENLSSNTNNTMLESESTSSSEELLQEASLSTSEAIERNLLDLEQNIQESLSQKPTILRETSRKKLKEIQQKIEALQEEIILEPSGDLSLEELAKQAQKTSDLAAEASKEMDDRKTFELNEKTSQIRPKSNPSNPLSSKNSLNKTLSNQLEEIQKDILKAQRNPNTIQSQKTMEAIAQRVQELAEKTLGKSKWSNNSNLSTQEQIDESTKQISKAVQRQLQKDQDSLEQYQKKSRNRTEQQIKQARQTQQKIQDLQKAVEQSSSNSQNLEQLIEQAQQVEALAKQAQQIINNSDPTKTGGVTVMLKREKYRKNAENVISVTPPPPVKEEVPRSQSGIQEIDDDEWQEWTEGQQDIN